MESNEAVVKDLIAILESDDLLNRRQACRNLEAMADNPAYASHRKTIKAALDAAYWKWGWPCEKWTNATKSTSNP